MCLSAVPGVACQQPVLLALCLSDHACLSRSEPVTGHLSVHWSGLILLVAALVGKLLFEVTSIPAVGSGVSTSLDSSSNRWVTTALSKAFCPSLNGLTLTTSPSAKSRRSLA